MTIKAKGLAKLALGALPALLVALPVTMIAEQGYGKSCPTGYVEFHEAVEPLGDLIAQGEGDWNAVNRGYAGDTPGGIRSITGKNFDQHTVNEVIQLQRWTIYAAGRYQFIPVTMRFAVANSDVKGTDKFNAETQNKLFAALLQYKRPAVGAYLRGDHDYLGWALNEMAKEWASVEYRYGRSYYAGIGGNRAHISRADLETVLVECREELNK